MLKYYRTCDPELLACFKKSNNKKGYTVNTGYHCVNNLCVECPVGSYGPDGINCYRCPFATWSAAGQTTCRSRFIYSAAGLHSAYIPFGVGKINIKLWGAGGGGDESMDHRTFVAHAGGGGGYTSCNVSVPMSQKVYVMVGGGGGGNSTKNNLGG